MKYYIGIDQGTTLTTAVVANQNMQILAKASVSHTNSYPKDGWVEQDPIQIYNNCIEACRIALTKIPGAKPEDVIAIGFDHQGETCCAWNRKTGKPIYPAIVWQDRRTACLAESINRENGEEILKITGLTPDSYYSATKIKWIIDNVPEAAELLENGDLLVGTLNTFVFWHLSGGECYKTEPSSASCMMLMDLKECRWSERVAEIVGIPVSILPEICDTSHEFGYTNPSQFFGAKVLLAASLNDSSAAIIGSGCYNEGFLKTSFGTGNFMSYFTGGEPFIDAENVVADCVWKKGDEKAYRLRGACYSAGAAVEWLINGIKIIEKPEETEVLSKSVSSTDGVQFVPAFSGLATPYWDSYARGMLIGITLGTCREHIVRAVLESIANQVAVCYNTMKKAAGGQGKVMRADGGMVSNDFLMQYQADMLGIPIEIPAEKETAAFGSLCAAAITMGDISSPRDVIEKVEIRKTYYPQMGEDERNKRISIWERAVKRSLLWAKE